MRGHRVGRGVGRAFGRSITRWLRQSPSGRSVASTLGAAYIRLIARSTRWTFEGRAEFDALIAPNGKGEHAGIIMAMWHGRLLITPAFAPTDRRKVIAMISNNHDGQVITDIVGRFGIGTVRGSSYDQVKQQDKGGTYAYHLAMKALAEEHVVLGITPDGPRGPRMRAQLGAAHLAIASGALVVPVSFATTRAKLLRSWDRFLLPVPFGRGAVVYGAALAQQAGETEALFRQRVEDALTAVTNRADDLCARPRVEAGPPLDLSTATRGR